MLRKFTRTISTNANGLKDDNKIYKDIGKVLAVIAVPFVAYESYKAQSKRKSIYDTTLNDVKDEYIKKK